MVEREWRALYRVGGEFCEHLKQNIFKVKKKIRKEIYQGPFIFIILSRLFNVGRLCTHILLHEAVCQNSYKDLLDYNRILYNYGVQPGWFLYPLWFIGFIHFPLFVARNSLISHTVFFFIIRRESSHKRIIIICEHT